MILKSLYGGGAACALFLISLTFNTRPSLAEPLAPNYQEIKAELKPKAEALVVSHKADQQSVASVSAPSRSDVLVADSPELKGWAEHLSSVGKETAAVVPLTAAQTFLATAYALRGRTASGQFVKRGLIAADRNVLPLGTRVRLDAGSYSGEYTVADRGSAVRGRKIDIWMPSNGEAMRFGKRKVKLTILSYGGRQSRRS